VSDILPVTAEVEALVAALGLSPHPEGGWYRETYRAVAAAGGRSAGTAIYYLLAAGHRSRLHRLDADEVWHFYRGDALELVELRAGAPPRRTELSAARPQHVVPAGTWFGALPAPGAAYCLAGCTMAPGFEFAGFELGSRAALRTAFPLAAEAIEQLTVADA
jgi:hypothetical protein